MGLKPRHLLASFALLGVLAGCGSPIVDMARGALGGGSDEPANAPVINRAAIEEAGVAAIVVSAETSGIQALTIAVAKRGSAITYISAQNRSIVLRGNLVFATRSFGTNLQSVTFAAEDPLVALTRAADWPATVQRTYAFTGQGPVFEQITATCDVSVGPSQTVDVVGVARSGRLIVEACRTDSGATFSNTHLIDDSTGQIWFSEQWTGPAQGSLTLGVIEPFSNE